MGQVNLPITLGAAYWEKHKGELAKLAKPPVTKLGDELKLLTKLHLAVDWDAFGSDGLARSEQAQARLAELESARGGRIKALALQVQAVEASALKFETDAKKDKQFPKDPLAAAVAVGKAAKGYRGDVDAFVAEARKALETRLAALGSQEKSAAKSDAGKGEAGPGDAKAAARVRSHGLDAIRKIKKPLPGASPVRFIVVQGKTSVATYMGPSVGPAQEQLLKGLIPDEAPYKTFKDPHGELVWEKKAVTFVTDSLPAGLGKKMQLWLKAILKFNLRLRVRRTNGEAEEIDGDDIADDLLDGEAVEADAPEETGAPPAGGTAAAADPSAAFNARLAALMPRIKPVLDAGGAPAADLKLKVSEAGTLARKREFEPANALLDAVQAQLPGGAARPGADAGAAPDLREAVQAWQEAREAVDGQIARLQKVLKESGDRDLFEISEYGLNGVMGNFKVRLMACLPELRTAQGDGLRAAAAKALPIAHGLAQHVRSEPRIEACDDNPFGVPVSIRGTLGGALDRLTAALQGAARA